MYINKYERIITVIFSALETNYILDFLLVFAPDDSSLSSDQDTNQFLV